MPHGPSGPTQHGAPSVLGGHDDGLQDPALASLGAPASLRDAILHRLAMHAYCAPSTSQSEWFVHLTKFDWEPSSPGDAQATA
jgi:hypothetical protein